METDWTTIHSQSYWSEEAIFRTELLSPIRKSRRSLAPPLLDDVLWWLSVWKSITALTIWSTTDRHSPIILHLEWEVPIHPLIQPSSGDGFGNNGPSTSHAVHTKRSVQHVYLVNERLIDGSPVAHHRHTLTNGWYQECGVVILSTWSLFQGCAVLWSCLCVDVNSSCVVCIMVIMLLCNHVAISKTYLDYPRLLWMSLIPVKECYDWHCCWHGNTTG